MNGEEPRGVLAWFAKNSVAANLMMVIIMVAGFLFMLRVKQEVFPEVDLDMVVVSVPYPGASPSEVEQGVLLAVEESVREVDGVKKMTSTASESNGSVVAELETSVDPDRALNDIKSAVDRITSLPQDAERPVVSLASSRAQVISVAIFGDVDRWTLKRMSEQVRDDLLAKDGITLVQTSGLPNPQISVEVPQERLRSLNTTHDIIARRISDASVELPGGGIKTKSGEVLVRLAERRETADEFGDIDIVTKGDGTSVKLRDIANIKDDFEETDQESLFNGKPSVQVKVFRTGDQTPISIAAIVNEYVEQERASLPPGVEYAIWSDRSEIYRDRIYLLLKNAGLGLILVMFILGLFLEIRLAFWATLGIPITFLGAFLFMTATGISLNMISLFGFLLALGIVVDDAIVVGESIYYERKHHDSFVAAAVTGINKVSVPVMFAVATTIVAFVPMLMVPGTSGKFFMNIPGVVIPILILSLFEVYFILPAHLAHGAKDLPRGFGWLQRGQERFSDGLERWVEKYYRPFANLAVQNRYLSLAVSIAVLIFTIGYMASGRIGFTFMPKIESDQIVASVELPFGTSVDDTKETTQIILGEAKALLEEMGGEAELSRGIYADVGTSGGLGTGPRGGVASSASHVAQVAVRLVPSDKRNFGAAEFTKRWRERVGEIPGVESLTFKFSIGPGAGNPIEFRLSHRDTEVLDRAAQRVADELLAYNGVTDVDDGVRLGKEQLDLKLTPEASSLGITERGLARQVRNAFFGAEAVRQQRGRDEVRVYVRRPLEERRSEYDIESLMIRTPSGGDVPLRVAANVTRGRSYTQIKREDGRRVLNVTADVETKVTTANQVVGEFTTSVMPLVVQDFPGLTWDTAGEQEEQRDSLSALGRGMVIAMLVIFALLAIAFRSYVQPTVIMFAIPFGIVGAITGHVVLGYGLSLISIMGIVALTGVVVNDSLVLVAAVNDFRKEGMSPYEAVIQGGVRRFRPILLTSLTTFFGLAPMIVETSVQARFLIPMAISLGFGVLFVTAIALIIVPCAYMSVEDMRRFYHWKIRKRPLSSLD